VMETLLGSMIFSRLKNNLYLKYLKLLILLSKKNQGLKNRRTTSKMELLWSKNLNRITIIKLLRRKKILKPINYCVLDPTPKLKKQHFQRLAA
jgi:hypothetical protein